MIELQHLTKRFATQGGTVVALNDINLTIRDGDVYGIIGMSGAGKSTLVRCINMLERPDEGNVIVNGKQMQDLRAADLRAARREITMIFQQFNLLMQRTCLRNIMFPMELAKVPGDKAEARARELLELVGLPDKADAYPAQLSGGQKQRIAIARALATDPKVLLCDEATSALDPNTTHAILQLIQKINRELGITGVIITHQMSVVEEVCNRVAILDNGTVVEEGEVQAIFSHPTSKAARRLVYPAGAPQAEVLPGHKLVRVAFGGTQTTDKPLVASLAIECGALVSIMAADTRIVNGQTLGSMLLALPQGVEAMDTDFPGLVQTSLNMGVVMLTSGGLHVTFSVRSSVASRKEMLAQRVRAITEMAGGTVSERGVYPGWQYDRNSQFRPMVLAAYKDMTGRDGVVEATHGGLECGLLMEKISGVDAVSMGPDILDIHSVRERLDVASTARVYDTLCEVLRRSK